MSHESIPNKSEYAGNVLNSAEAKQHKERLKEQIESKAEKAQKSPEAEQVARHEVEAQAISGAEMIPTNSESTQQSATPPPTKADKSKSFKTTMHHVRKDLSGPERTLSRVIHQPAIEKVSEVAGKTIARPSGMIGAAVAALVGLAFVFGIAKYAGFSLSGSEMPLLLIIGMLLGLLAEWAYKALRSLLT